MGVLSVSMKTLLTSWSCDIIRKTFYEGGIDELVSLEGWNTLSRHTCSLIDSSNSVVSNRFDTDTKSASLTFTLRLMLNG